MAQERVVKGNVVIPTKNRNKQVNGYLVPIWNALEDDWRPEQVYLTVVLPGMVKGPHLHRQRVGRFTCVKGDVSIITRENGEYMTRRSGQNYNYATIFVPAGVPAAIYNLGITPALVLNMPSPAWSPKNQDEWPVEEWIEF